MGTSFPFPFSSPFSFSFTPIVSRAAQLGVTKPDIVGGMDRVIDPATGSFVRTADGAWEETADSRTSMLIAMSVELGESPFDPSHGTAIAAQQRAGGSLSPEFLQAEAARVGDILTRAGVLSDLIVQVRDADGNRLRDSDGRTAVRMQWRDLASGSPVDATISVSR